MRLDCGTGACSRGTRVVLVLVAGWSLFTGGCAVMKAKRDARLNRDGCSPEVERIDRLKRLVDKENLESENPAIKRAAQIKKQEDLAQQKIKAIKYLGMQGCGSCYDKDGSVTEALLLALEDCTPEVRMATIQVISGCFCDQQYPRTCCNEKIVKKLADMAWGTDDAGQFKEPDANIRNWAAQVAMQCCPGGYQEPTVIDTPAEVPPIPTPMPVEGGTPDAPAPPEADPTTALPEPLPLQSQMIPASATSAEAFGSQVADPLVANLLCPETELRKSTIEVIRQASIDGFDFRSATPDRNGDTVLQTLRLMAWGYDRQGEWVEQDQSIRDAAKEAVLAIDPECMALNRPFVTSSPLTVAAATATPVTAVAARMVVKPQPVAPQILEPVAVLQPVAPAALQPAPVATVAAPVTPSTPEMLVAVPVDVAAAAPVAVVAAPPLPLDLPAVTADVVAEPVAAPLPVNPAPAAIAAAEPVQVAPAPVVAPVAPVAVTTPKPAVPETRGIIELVDANLGTAIVRLPKQTMLPKGTRIVVYHRYLLGRIAAAGEFEVTEAAPGMATIRSIDGGRLTGISVGDQAKTGTI